MKESFCHFQRGLKFSLTYTVIECDSYVLLYDWCARFQNLVAVAIVTWALLFLIDLIIFATSRLSVLHTIMDISQLKKKTKLPPFCGVDAEETV